MAVAECPKSQGQCSILAGGRANNGEHLDLPARENVPHHSVVGRRFLFQTLHRLIIQPLGMHAGADKLVTQVLPDSSGLVGLDVRRGQPGCEKQSANDDQHGINNRLQHEDLLLDIRAECSEGPGLWRESDHHDCTDQTEEAEASESPLRREQQPCGVSRGWSRMHGVSCEQRKSPQAESCGLE